MRRSLTVGMNGRDVDSSPEIHIRAQTQTSCCRPDARIIPFNERIYRIAGACKTFAKWQTDCSVFVERRRDDSPRRINVFGTIRPKQTNQKNNRQLEHFSNCSKYGNELAMSHEPLVGTIIINRRCGIFIPKQNNQKDTFGINFINIWIYI